MNDPRPNSPYCLAFTVEYLGNIVGGDRVTYINADIELVKQIALQAILDGEPVWFGCDTGKMLRRDLGIWDKNLFDYEGVYDAEMSMSKAERLLYHETAMNHAMVFRGSWVAWSDRGWRLS